MLTKGEKIMINYKYKEIKCPKCGKSHFKVKRHNTDFGYDIVPAIFTYEADEEYKDGVLQNPPKPKPAIEKFKCLECGCNFRTETYPVTGDIAVVPNIINEDEEESFLEKIIREHNEEVTKQMKEAKFDKDFQQRTNECQEDFDGNSLNNILTVKTDEPTVSYMIDETKISGYEELKMKVDSIQDRLNKIEERLE